MSDWLSIQKETIFTGKDEKGNRYLSRFLSDYKKAFNLEDINAGCKKCLDEYYKKMTKHLREMSKSNKNPQNSGYVLKAKYNGIPLKFGSPILVTNANITDEMAKDLLKNHKKGEDLFEKIPEGNSKPQGSDDPLKELLKYNRDVLDAKATELGVENPSSLPNKEAVAKAILEAQEKPQGSDE